MARPDPARRFRWWLAAIVVAGFAIRLAWILIERRDVQFGGDAGFYHLGANLLADGKGFIQPFHLDYPRPAADHPPLYMLWLTIPSLLGLRSQLDHLIWSAALGAGTIAVVGLTGREIGGRRLGLIAAAIAAVYPNLWIPDGSLMAETVAIFTTAIALLYAYRYWHDPTWVKLAVVGLAAGVGALSRSELVLIVPLMVVPLAVLVPGIVRRDRWRAAGAGALAAVVVMAPWAIFNATRFEQPAVLSTQFGLTLSAANCDEIWHGGNSTYFSIRCSLKVERTLEPGLDASEQDAAHRDAAIEYITGHFDEYPSVAAKRIGAIFGIYDPEGQIHLDGYIEGRGVGIARVGMYSFYLLALLSIGGAVLLRRRRAVPLFPLLVPPAMVVITVVTTYASTRFRASAEVTVCLLAAVAIDRMVRRFRDESAYTGIKSTV